MEAGIPFDAQQKLNAVRASGAIVEVDESAFVELLNRQESPLVVVSKGGLIFTHYEHLMSYKGLIFYCRASAPVPLPPLAEIVQAECIWIPS